MRVRDEREIRLSWAARGHGFDGADDVHEVGRPSFVVRPWGRLLGDDSILVLESWMCGSMHYMILGNATGGARRALSPRHKLMVAPRLGTSFATWVWTFGPSGLMAAPRLGTLFAT
jgi:hypothetical protein